jgi:hypothetical protein
MSSTLGFIILRYVNSVETNQYWINCYDCIRKLYPENYIVIIDDNSKYKFITPKALYKTTIIISEFPQRGEILPYYYYLKNKLFDTAVIIHDSVFIQKPIDFTVDKYKILLDFHLGRHDIEDETKMLKVFNDEELLEFYHQDSWVGCFGAMTVITHDFLRDLNNKYDISLLLNHIFTRWNRCSCERVIGCLLQKHHPNETLIGNLYDGCIPFGIGFDIYKNGNYENYPLIKIWSGRDGTK